MVDVKIETKKPAENPRDAIRDKRQRRLRLIRGEAPATVTVYAANESFRDYLRHANGTRFRDDGSAEWPNDSFTARRIRDGAVRTDSAGAGEAAEPDESLNPRQQAAASTAKSKAAESKSAPKPQPQPQPTA